MELLKNIVRPLKCGPEILSLAEAFEEKHVTALGTALQLVVAEMSSQTKDPAAAIVSSSSSSTTSITSTTNNSSAVVIDFAKDRYAFEIPYISCMSPRGRHTLKLGPHELCLSAKKGDVVVQLSDIRRAYSLDKVDNYGKVTACLWLLVLSTPVPVGKQTTSTIVFSTSPKPVEGMGKKSKSPSIIQVEVNSEHLPISVEGFENFKGTDYGIMQKMFSTPNLLCSNKTRTNNTSYFTSSRNTPIIKCYCGVNDGLLFPLPDGLFFVGKPYTFVDIQDMAGLECNKGGSGRTLDFNVHTHDEVNHTFGMIEKEETKALQHYIQMILKRAQKNAAASSSSSSSSKSSSSSSSSSRIKSSSPLATNHADGQHDSPVVVDNISDPEEDDEDEDGEDSDSDFDLTEARRELDEADEEDDVSFEVTGENDGEVYEITDDDSEEDSDEGEEEMPAAEQKEKKLKPSVSSAPSAPSSSSSSSSSSVCAGTKRTAINLGDSDTESDNEDDVEILNINNNNNIMQHVAQPAIKKQKTGNDHGIGTAL